MSQIDKEKIIKVMVEYINGSQPVPGASYVGTDCMYPTLYLAEKLGVKDEVMERTGVTAMGIIPMVGTCSPQPDAYQRPPYREARFDIFIMGYGDKKMAMTFFRRIMNLSIQETINNIALIDSGEEIVYMKDVLEEMLEDHYGPQLDIHTMHHRNVKRIVELDEFGEEA